MKQSHRWIYKMKSPLGKLWRVEEELRLSSHGISDQVPIPLVVVPYWSQDIPRPIRRLSQPRTDMTLSPGASPQLPSLLSRPPPSSLDNFHHHYYSLPKVQHYLYDFCMLSLPHQPNLSSSSSVHNHPNMHL